MTFATPVNDRTGALGDLTDAGRKVHRLKALMSHMRKEHDRV